MDSLPSLRVYALFMMSVCAQTEFLLLSACVLLCSGAWAWAGQQAQTSDGGFAFL